MRSGHPINALAIIVAVVITAGAVLFAQQPPASEQAPVFRGGVELIQLVVSVLNDKRQPVRGLTAADFTVLDGGVVRPVRAFTAVDLPPRRLSAGEAPWTRDVAPDIATNQVGEQPGRLVIILMDRSIPLGQPTITARAIATTVVDELGPGDLAAMMSTSGGVPQNFTADRSRLRRAIDQRDWSTGISKDAEALPTIGKQDPLSDPRCLCGLCVLETVTRIADAVRDTPGRSTVLFFIGSSLIVQAPLRAPRLDVGCDRLVREARRAMFDSLALSSLTVHSIDPGGLINTGPQTRAGALGGQPGRDGQADRRQMMLDETSEQLSNQGTLRVLPDLTGGRTVVSANAPETMVPELFGESESYYVLGFEAAPSARTGTPRSIEVKVARRGVRVSTQRQYLPPTAANAPSAPSTAATLSSPTSPDDALSGLLPDATPPLTMALAAFASPDGPNGAVSVSVDASGFVYDTESSIPLDVSVTVADQTGRPVASARQASTIPGPRPASSDRSPIQIPTHLALPPGDYEVRVAVTDTARGTTASVFSQVVVPAFASERLSLSDIAIERGNAASAPAAPTTDRSFQRTDSVQAFLQIYQGTERTDAMQSVSMRVRIVDTRDVAVRDQSLVLEPAQFSTNRTATSRLTLPVQNLAPGNYLLRLDATMGDRAASRVARFTVE